MLKGARAASIWASELFVISSFTLKRKEGPTDRRLFHEFLLILAVLCKSMHPFSWCFNKECNTKILNCCISTAAAVVICDPVGLPGNCWHSCNGRRENKWSRFSPQSRGVWVGHLLVCVDLGRLGFSLRLNGWCKQSIFFYPNHPGEESSECTSHNLAVEHVAEVWQEPKQLLLL